MASPILFVQPRDSHESHRVATPLELLFDLISVVAIAAAAAGLHHAVSAAHAAEGIITFLIAFFAIWWAWMNYTWFASAYGNDGSFFRLVTMLIMAGSLVMAAGITTLNETGKLDFVIIGYVIMRIGMIVLWLGAWAADGARRPTALAYAIGITIVQVYWTAQLVLQPSDTLWIYTLVVIGIALEISVPAIAERQGTTPWHRHHIMERYGLLTIIVLGETLLSGVNSLRQLGEGPINVAFVHIALSALVIVFSLWWLYFSREEHLTSGDLRRALTWGYGHFAVFASGAAVGAGFGVLVDVIDNKAKVPLIVGDYAVAIPVAVFLIALWAVRDRFILRGVAIALLPAAAILVLVAPLTPVALEGIAALAALTVFLRSIAVRQNA